MRRTIGLLLLALTASTLVADTPPSGFTSLIQTDSIAGWRGSTDDWKVEDGVLIGTADGTLKANRFIVADIEPVHNFELTVDVWISKGGNSGLQYRSKERPDLGPFVVTGYQCDVVSNNPNYNGMLYEERGRRILAHTGERVVIDTDSQPWITSREKPTEFEPEAWHRYRVVVEGNHHRHWIDDVLTVDVIDLDEKNRSLEGVLGVQVHVGPPMTIRYRNFFLKRLADDLAIISPEQATIPDDATPVEPQGGWKNQPKPKRPTQSKSSSPESAKLVPAPIGSTKPSFRHGHIWLAGQPAQDDFKLMKELGITTVVNLRPDVELTWDQSEVVQRHGLKYVSIPVIGANNFTDDKIDKTREIMCQACSDGNVLLHCGSAQRVGTAWIAYRVLDDGVSVETACQEAEAFGMRSQALVNRALEYIESHRKK